MLDRQAAGWTRDRRRIGRRFAECVWLSNRGRQEVKWEEAESGTEAEDEELFPRPNCLRRILVSCFAFRDCMRKPRGIGQSSGCGPTGLQWSMVRSVHARHLENFGTSTSV